MSNSSHCNDTMCTWSICSWLEEAASNNITVNIWRLDTDSEGCTTQIIDLQGNELYVELLSGIML